MGDSMNIPAGWDASSTTRHVADLIAGLTLPLIEPLDTDISAMSSFPKYPVPHSADPAVPRSGDRIPDNLQSSAENSSHQGPQSQLESARLLMDECTDALVALKKHQNQCAALAAVLIERLQATALLEATVLNADPWQHQQCMNSIRAEIASILSIPENMSERLLDHASTLVQQLPTTLATLVDGGLGWEHAVVIAEETDLLRAAGLPPVTIHAFEQALLEKAAASTLPSFREKARRLRERQYPETIPARTRRAYSSRYLRISHGQDGMSWLSLYAPAPTLEGVWNLCTRTAQAAQGPHEDRTLTQLRADVAAALLLNQSMEENSVYSPTPDAEAGTGTAQEFIHSPFTTTSVVKSSKGLESLGNEKEPSGESLTPDLDRGDYHLDDCQVPVYDDPNYGDVAFRAPDIDDWADWIPAWSPPDLIPSPKISAGTTTRDKTDRVWPPMPQVTPVLMVPILSLLGATNEPAWMEGAGPISMEVARHLVAQSSSFYRILVDPISNQTVDSAPERYRTTKAMQTMLRIRDEYCQFPGCNAKAHTSEIDHIRQYENGGSTTFMNLEVLCRRHHALKHFKDNRTRQGHYRTDQTPERREVKMRGWTPAMTDRGIAWSSPSGRYHPPKDSDSQPPTYPKWLRKIVELKISTQDQHEIDSQGFEDEMGIFLSDQDDYCDQFTTAEPTEELIPSDEDEEILTEMAIKAFLANEPLADTEE
ncbi:DUF222 domain-containing protein [Arthrobacter sp. lap29]|uniref:HNH endonuclease signature motif containing protein n=1 Tax=Arthrobacter sp. lap29 TaxID=3056122 RepID=UPI0028F73A90|nr:DUF222 domain-containing protein [Arthrobacter sp. lap29]